MSQEKQGDGRPGGDERKYPWGNNVTKVKKRITKVVLVFTATILVVFLLIAFGEITLFFKLFGWLQHQVRTITGWDHLLANATTALLIGLVLTLPIWGIIRAFLPLPQSNKKIYRFMFLGCIAALFGASYFFSQDVYFDVETGKPLKWYAPSPDGDRYDFYTSSGFHPVTGDSLKEVTREIVLEQLNLQEQWPMSPKTEQQETEQQETRQAVRRAGGYINSDEVREKLAYQSHYTNEQRELFFQDMRGHRTIFKEYVAGINVTTNRVALEGRFFPFYYSAGSPYLQFREKAEFKKIMLRREFTFDCRITGYYLQKGSDSKSLSFDDCFVVDN